MRFPAGFRGAARCSLSPGRALALCGLLATALAPFSARGDERAGGRNDVGLLASVAYTYANVNLASGSAVDAASMRYAVCVTLGRYGGIEYSEHKVNGGRDGATLSTVSFAARIPLRQRWDLLLRFGLSNIHTDDHEGVANGRKDPGRKLQSILPLTSHVSVYSIGLQRRWNRKWSLRGEWEVFPTVVDGATRRDSYALSLGLQYQIF